MENTNLQTLQNYLNEYEGKYSAEYLAEELINKYGKEMNLSLWNDRYLSLDGQNLQLRRRGNNYYLRSY